MKYCLLSISLFLSLEAGAANSYLFHVDKDGAKYAWNITQVETKFTKTLLRTREAPFDAILDLKSHIAFFKGEKKLYIAPFEGRAEITNDLFDPCYRKAWAVHAKSRNLLAVMNCDSGFLEDGVLHVDDEEFPAIGEGPDYYYQLVDHRDWKPITREQWRNSANDALDFSPLLDSVTCEKTKCEKAIGKAPPAALAKIPGKDSLVYFPFGPDSAILFGILEADAVHGSVPAYVCTKKCENIFPLGLDKNWGELGQITVSKKGDFALIAGEYRGKQGLVFRAGESKPYLDLQKSTLVTWLPDDQLWRLAK